MKPGQRFSQSFVIPAPNGGSVPTKRNCVRRPSGAAAARSRALPWAVSSLRVAGRVGRQPPLHPHRCSLVHKGEFDRVAGGLLNLGGQGCNLRPFLFISQASRSASAGNPVCPPPDGLWSLCGACGRRTPAQAPLSGLGLQRAAIEDRLPAAVDSVRQSRAATWRRSRTISSKTPALDPALCPLIGLCATVADRWA